jgi:hypothetical protein
MFALILFALAVGAVLGSCALLGALVMFLQSAGEFLSHFLRCLWRPRHEPAPPAAATPAPPPPSNRHRRKKGQKKRRHDTRHLQIATYYRGDEEPRDGWFFLDQNMDPLLAKKAARFGLNVIHASEVGMAGALDPNLLGFACRRKRIMVSHDNDFHYLAKEFFHCGVLVFRQGPEFHGEIIRLLLNPSRAEAAKS